MKLKLSKPISLVLALVSLTLAIVLARPFVAAQPTVLTYGDTNIEPITTNPLDNYVDALTKIVVTQPTTITSVSLFIQYSGSDGSQCIKFGIYGDNGGSWALSNPISQPLIAYTHNGYCLYVGNFGPAWETWPLVQSDWMVIKPGTYWLATLASEDFGQIYHFTYQGAYGGQYLYNYGYFNYAFPASYLLGFPPTTFGNTTWTNGQGNIIPFNSADIGTYNAPYSFYVSGFPTGTQPIPEFPALLLATTTLLLPLLLIRRRKTQVSK